MRKVTRSPVGIVSCICAALAWQAGCSGVSESSPTPPVVEGNGGTAGASGTTDASVGGNAGVAGTATGGNSGYAGVAGSAGSGGIGGSAGTGGVAGTAGSSVAGMGGWGASPPCSYQDIPGKATITSIEPGDPTDGYSCSNKPVIAKYSFSANNSSIPPSDYDPSKYGFKADMLQRIRIPAGTPLYPPESCLPSLGVSLNAQLTMTRRLVTSGSCTPVLEEFPEMDFTQCKAQCN